MDRLVGGVITSVFNLTVPAQFRLMYKDYLKTTHWLNFKKLVFDRYRSCQVCDYRRGLHVHHRHYSSLGNEALSDVLLLCGRCHDEIHKIAVTLDPTRLELAYHEILRLYGRKRRKPQKHPRKKVIKKIKQLQVERPKRLGMLGRSLELSLNAPKYKLTTSG